MADTITPTGNNIVVTPSPLKGWALPFINNVDLWMSLGKAMDDNRGATPATNTTQQLAILKAQLLACVAILVAAAATVPAVVTAFTVERSALGSFTVLTGANYVATINGWTTANLPEMVVMSQVIKSAVNKGLAVAALAATIKA